VNFDPATGQFDASRTDSATTHSQKARRQTIEDIVYELQGEQPAPVEEVVEVATERHDLAESTVEETIDQLKHQGEVYEPGHGEVRTT